MAETADGSNFVIHFEFLRVLNTGYIPNEMVRHRETNRCVTINTLVNLRFLKSVERTNTLLAWIVIVLAVVDVTASVIQIVK